jgi:hypothetical protein
MRLLQLARDLLRALKGSAGIEIQEKIIEIQAGILEMQEQVTQLQKENQALREQLATAGSLSYRSHAYWRQGHADPGPFCARCWDLEKQLIHLGPTFDPKVLGCPRCRSAVAVSDADASGDSFPPSLGPEH